MTKHRKDTVTVETPVGVREVAPDQPWWKGTGRGHVREFITQEETHKCEACGEKLPETAFPTLAIPRKDGRTRGHVCRECVNARRAERAAKAKRQEAARKAAETRRKRAQGGQAQAA